MKILFIGGWREYRDPEHTKETIDEYCRSLAKHVISDHHQVILTSTNASETLIAQEILSRAKEAGRKVKDHLIYLLPEGYKEMPTEGRVLTFEKPRWRREDRTYYVQQADAVIAVGGGKGTTDCIQKAFLAEKPVFVACAIPGSSSETWKRQRPHDYRYLSEGDADFSNDMNISPDDFFDEVFRVLNSLGEIKYSRRIFVVHGRDYLVRDHLVSILRKLEFEPIVLQKEPSRSLTVIEKLERDVAGVGFAFIIYTADDVGRLKGEPEQPRARQNVIFEHGLLMGLLRRERTCALVQSNIEIPSDLTGVVYERFSDLEEEAIKIARILKAAGYPVNAGLLV